MNNFWDKWQKPFTEDQTKDLILHASLPQRELAKVSGRALGTINKWSKEVRARRRDFISVARTMDIEAHKNGLNVEPRPIGVIEDGYFERMLALHEEGAKVSGVVARLFFKVVHKQVSEVKNESRNDKEMSEKALKVLKDNSLAAERWMSILEKSIQLERQASGVEVWQDINMAVRVIKDAGGDVSLPETLNHIVAQALKEHVEIV